MRVSSAGYTALSSSAVTIEINETTAGTEHPRSIGLDVSLPATGQPAAALVCVPGGSMNRRYYDLPTVEGEETASFVAAMTARGFIVVTMDYPGVGESPLPEDPMLLTPELLADAIGQAGRRAVTDLRSGRFPGIDHAFPDLASIGVGHSFGAALTIVAQARSHFHSGLVLMGYGLDGMPHYLSEGDRALPIAEVRDDYAAIVARRSGSHYVKVPDPEPARRRRTDHAIDELLGVAANAALFPRLFADEVAAIDVPVLLAAGDNDLMAAPHDFAAEFVKSADVTSLILPETRHNHFLYPSRTALFERITHWATRP